MLLPVDMREWFPPDQLVWFVLEVVDALNTCALERTRRRGGSSAAGNDPRMLFGLLIYAYCQRVRSSRQLVDLLDGDDALSTRTADRPHPGLLGQHDAPPDRSSWHLRRWPLQAVRHLPRRRGPVGERPGTRSNRRAFTLPWWFLSRSTIPVTRCSRSCRVGGSDPEPRRSHDGAGRSPTTSPWWSAALATRRGRRLVR